MRQRIVLLTLLCLLLSVSPASSVESEQIPSCRVTAKSCVPAKFMKQAKSKALSDPAILVVDPTNSAELHGSRPDSPSIPASVMKILTSFTALTYLGGEYQFLTTTHRIESTSSLVIIGQNDPWLTMYRSISQKYGPAYAPDLILKAIPKEQRKSGEKVKLDIYYTGLFASDIAGLTAHFKPTQIKLRFFEISQRDAKAMAGEQVFQLGSATINQMVEFAVLYSDNRLSQRLAEHSAKAHGYKKNPSGLQRTFEDALLSKTIGVNGLVIKDGSGLSKENRVTARTIVDLLSAIRDLPEYSSIYEGLPKSGKTGTLKNRFKTTSPDAVGLVKAKTGWVNGTVSLAGYITAGEKELVFAVLADRIPKYYSATLKARASIDRMIGSLAKPKPDVVVQALDQ